jgi:hypothetical protein
MSQFRDVQLIDGFKDAADRVVEGSANESVHPDKYFGPVGFLYRHYLELALKYIISCGQSLYDEQELPPHGHGLKSLWESARAYLIRAWPEGDSSELKIIEDAITDFDEIDSSGQEFRYVKTKKGNSSLAHAPRIISLEHLKEKMHELYRFISGCALGLEVYLEYKRDMESEMWNSDWV